MTGATLDAIGRARERITQAVQRSFGPPLAAGALALVAMLVLPWGVPSDHEYGDAHLYLTYGARMLEGDIPYRDFYVEYPPGALPVFLLPAGLGGHEMTAFRVLMALCWAVAAAASVLLARRLAGRFRALLAAAAVIVFAAIFAPLLLNTYDAWPAMLVAIGLYALIMRKPRLAGAMIGLAAAAKLLPVLLLPIAVLHARRTGDARRLLIAAAVAAAVVTAPFVILGSTGLAFSLESQLRRGLHVESVPATVILLAHRLGLTDARTAVQPPGSLNLVSQGSGAVALVSSLALLAVCCWLAWKLTPRSSGARSTAVFALAVIAATLVFGKVLSPQFLVWAAPVVAAVARPSAVLLLTGAAGLSIAWPLGWITPFDLDADVWSAVARNALLVGVAAITCAQLLRERMQEEQPDRDHDEVA